jgi:hypothetical protein
MMIRHSPSCRRARPGGTRSLPEELELGNVSYQQSRAADRWIREVFLFATLSGQQAVFRAKLEA